MPNKIKNKKVVFGWLKKAEDDLSFAKIALKETNFCDHICFLSQQAVEKYLKAVIIVSKGNLAKKEKTHNLIYLAQRCKQVLSLKKFESDLRKLSNAYITARYPSNGYVKFSKDEARNCLKSAEKVIDFIKNGVDFTLYLNN